jgi:proline dehydrogenase
MTSAIRAFVLAVLHSHPIRWVATRRRLGWRVASRFVAGEGLDDAMAAARELDHGRIATILDHLGEDVTSERQAIRSADTHLRALEAIAAADELDCAISIKLTQLGLGISRELCLAQVERVLSAAGPAGTLVMIDMEASPHVDDTLELFRDLRLRHDPDRVGVCLQSYLRRTPGDVLALPEASVVRLVKGAYLEPKELAFERRRDVDRAWARLFTTLVTRGHTVHAATHDARLIAGATGVVEDRSIPWSHVEFQMLYGVRRDLQERLARQEYPVRVYVPYGAEWYPYLTRRLAERPANMWFFLSNLVRRRRRTERRGATA